MIQHCRRMKKMVVLLAVTMIFSGCGLLYTDVQVPRAYRSATPLDVKASGSDKIVEGESCNHSVLFLVAWGNGGYVEATRDALAHEPIGSILYDVQADLKAKAYAFGLYTQTCTVVTGRVGTL